MSFGSVECIIDNFTALKQHAIPEINQLLAEIGFHIGFKNIRQVLQKCLFVRCKKQFERLPIDIQNTDFAHALADEFRMYIGENAEINNAALADIVHQLFDTAEVFHPKRDRRMLKQAFCVLLVLVLLASRLFTRCHVFDGQENAIPAFLMAGQNHAFELDVETLAA